MSDYFPTYWFWTTVYSSREAKDNDRQRIQQIALPRMQADVQRLLDQLLIITLSQLPPPKQMPHTLYHNTFNRCGRSCTSCDNV